MFPLVLMLIVSCLIFGQTKQATGQNTAKEITALENAWNDAVQKYDVSWFERNIADSYIGTDENGIVQDKAATIAEVKDKVSKIESIYNEAFKVQAYGDTAVATGIYVLKGTHKGKDSSGRYPFTDTWVKLAGRWQCVASHNSKIPSK
jgi:ketosteroid isomerase-like protein